MSTQMHTTDVTPSAVALQAALSLMSSSINIDEVPANSEGGSTPRSVGSDVGSGGL